MERYGLVELTHCVVLLLIRMLGWGRDGDPLEGGDPADLRTVLNAAFQQRRKMLRGSLKGLINSVGGQPLPELQHELRPPTGLA